MESIGIPHIVRTSDQPRQNTYYLTEVKEVKEVNSSVRVIQLQVRAWDPENAPALTWLPGQWVDVHYKDLKGLDEIGGYTITSSPEPQEGLPKGERMLELAIQKREGHAPAEWFWRPIPEIIGPPVKIRVGGKFVWPPQLPHEVRDGVANILFIAGGMGINPIISMLQSFYDTSISIMKKLESGEMPSEPYEEAQALQATVVYSTRSTKTADGKAEEILFLDRLVNIAKNFPPRFANVKVFLHDTGSKEDPSEDLRKPLGAAFETRHRRVTHDDLTAFIDGTYDKPQLEGNSQSNRAEILAKRKTTACYVCGPSDMTDDFVAWLEGLKGMAKERVLCERWWDFGGGVDLTQIVRNEWSEEEKKKQKAA